MSFDIDANGILHVSAKDKGTGKEQKITITDNTGLSDSEIDNMVKDAEANAETDKKRREAIDARNQLDSLIYNTDKTVKENKDKIDEEDFKKAEEALEEARKHVQSEDADAIKAQIEALTQVSHDLAQKIYAKQADGQGGDGDGAGGGDASGGEGGAKAEQDDVVDAEFEDISNKK